MAKARQPRTDKPTNKAAQKAETRICVPAPMPVQCPKCRSSKTTAANGVHYNLHFATRYEHRVCTACNYSFTAMRRMTAEELAEKKPKSTV